MTYRLAINGYGRIGQCVLRALYENGYRDDLQVVAINELADLETIAHLTRYDSTHGRFQGEVTTTDTGMVVNGDAIRVLRSRDAADMPWRELDVDLVLECTGAFSDRQTATGHLDAGAARLLFSQPAEPDVDRTVVYGINEQDLTGSDRIVSNASCTTNCIVPIIHALDQALGVEQGAITTIHAAMNDQPVIDAYHKSDLRLTRSAMQSIIPVDTGLARGIERLMPALAGRFECLHVRVPTINVSAMDMAISVRQACDAATVNALLAEASRTRLAGRLGYTEEPLASVDFNHDPRSGIVDATQTRVAGGHLVKLFSWFDNEWGFANRMLDVAARLAELDARP